MRPAVRERWTGYEFQTRDMGRGLASIAKPYSMIAIDIPHRAHLLWRDITKLAIGGLPWRWVRKLAQEVDEILLLDAAAGPARMRLTGLGGLNLLFRSEKIAGCVSSR